MMTVTVKANQADLLMEVDTGASASLISEATYKQLLQGNLPRLKKTNVKLHTYSGELLKVLGSITIDVVYEGQNEKLPLLVVAGEGPSLLGKNWMTKIRLNWNKLVHKVQVEDYTLDAVLQKHPDVFKERLGLVKDYSAKIHVDPSSSPRFCKAKPVAYAFRVKVNAELDRLQQEGIIEPVEFSEWAAPIVPVIKSNGSLRICGDYKVTVNSASKLDKYPLPRIEGLCWKEGRFTPNLFYQVPFNKFLWMKSPRSSQQLIPTRPIPVHSTPVWNILSTIDLSESWMES